MKYLILAAGRSKRFGRNKLEEKFNGSSLPQLAAKFAMENSADEIYLTLSKSSVRTDGSRVYHQVLDDVSKVCSPIINFQPDDVYGPGAAIEAWSGVIEGPFVVLFGDNYYKGLLGGWESIFADPTDPTVYFTYLNRDINPRNLQLSAVIEDFVIEKPHSFLSGDFFCGMVRFPAGSFSHFSNLQRSDRGELEITDMINLFPNRKKIHLLEICNEWADLTYQTDAGRIRRLIGDEGE